MDSSVIMFSLKVTLFLIFGEKTDVQTTAELFRSDQHPQTEIRCQQKY